MLAVAAKTVILSLCLSLLVAAAFAVHFATGWTTLEREDLKFGATFLSTLLILVWPASIPLSLAVILLHRRSRLVAYLCAVALVPLSIVGFIVADLLQSEIVVIAVAALSLPAWLALLMAKLWELYTYVWSATRFFHSEGCLHVGQSPPPPLTRAYE